MNITVSVGVPSASVVHCWSRDLCARAGDARAARGEPRAVGTVQPVPASPTPPVTADVIGSRSSRVHARGPPGGEHGASWHPRTRGQGEPR
jgi:hypothetical protein